MDELGLDTKRLPPRSVSGVISQAKSELIDFETFRANARGDPFAVRIAEVYAQYQQRLLAANAMDFDDLLMVAVNLLEASDVVRTGYQQRFKHILVDEYQDTNQAQNRLVILLGAAHGNVCVVGDSDQSVYRWRGADISNILQFEQAFANATTVLLEQNYRSTQRVLDAANAIIAQQPGPPAQAPLHRGRRGPADRPLPGRRRARRGVLRGQRAVPPPRPRAAQLLRTWPSSTGPTRRAGCSRRSWSAGRSPTRWWAAPASTTGAR